MFVCEFEVFKGTRQNFCHQKKLCICSSESSVKPSASVKHRLFTLFSHKQGRKSWGGGCGGVWRGVTSPITNTVDFAWQSKSLQGAKEILSQRSNRLISAAVMLSCLQICCFKHKLLPGNTHTYEGHITAMPFYRSE